jgi:hypothetical protein
MLNAGPFTRKWLAPGSDQESESYHLLRYIKSIFWSALFRNMAALVQRRDR